MDRGRGRERKRTQILHSQYFVYFVMPFYAPKNTFRINCMTLRLFPPHSLPHTSVTRQRGNREKRCVIIIIITIVLLFCDFRASSTRL